MLVGIFLKTDSCLRVCVLCITSGFPAYFLHCQFHSGGKRKLRIPPELAYGPEPAGCFSGELHVLVILNIKLIHDLNYELNFAVEFQDATLSLCALKR